MKVLYFIVLLILFSIIPAQAGIKIEGGDSPLSKCCLHIHNGVAMMLPRAIGQKVFGVI
ncbi:MAG: hypothetical protein KAT32_05150 [Candidatus Moranbacteria bacterium]|nr:hypothetical protein [Candidatus Moranbacteria bacterium]